MLIHQYEASDGQYVHSFLADPDPRNPDRWLEPAFTTPLPLPTRNRFEWPFFREGAWVMLPDYRGVVLYRTDTGEPAEIVKAGITPQEAGLTPDPRPSELHHWTDSGWALDPARVAERARAEAMAEFDQLMALARAKNAGKADGYAAGLLSPTEAAIFKAWSNYQLDLVRVINAPDFPAVRNWPEQPDEGAIAEAVAASEAQPPGAPEEAAEGQSASALPGTEAD